VTPFTKYQTIHKGSGYRTVKVVTLFATMEQSRIDGSVAAK